MAKNAWKQVKDMNISGIRPSVGFYNFSTSGATGNIRPASEPVTEVQEAQVASTSAEENSAEISEARSKQTFSSTDYAQQYKAGETFEMKGKDSDLHTLDVEKAISDMKKDQMLSQYQYFVGESVSMATQSANQIRGAENFNF